MPENVPSGGTVATLADQLRALATLIDEAHAVALPVEQLLDREFPDAVEGGQETLRRAFAELEVGLRPPLTVRSGGESSEVYSAVVAAEQFLRAADRPGRQAPVRVLDANGHDVTNLVLAAVSASSCVAAAVEQREVVR